MENPYASPLPPKPQPPGMQPNDAPHDSVAASAHFVGHVRIVSIFMIVQSCLELLVGLGAALVSVLGIVAVQNNNMRRELDFNDEMEPLVLAVIYGVIAALMLTAGGLRLCAGILNLGFRGRGLGLVSHFAGFVTVLTCYCGFTGLAVGIYGAIVYLQPAVKQAFELRRQGQTPAQILEHFRRLQYRY